MPFVFTPLIGLDALGPWIFLWGPIKCLENWQRTAIDCLLKGGFDGNIASPRQPFPEMPLPSHRDQLIWEGRYSGEALRHGAVICYFPKDYDFRNGEIRWLHLPAEPSEGSLLVVCIEPGFKGKLEGALPKNAIAVTTIEDACNIVLGKVGTVTK